MIAIVDCEIGNLRSVEKAFEKIGQKAKITFDASEIEGSTAVVLPGVGAFKDAITFLRSNHLDRLISQLIKQNKPFLGICLGLQLLFSFSEEGEERGLDIIKGEVRRLPALVKVPQMGWNRLEKKKDSPILSGIPENAYFYFAHSYYVVPEDPLVTIALTDYGVKFTSIIGRNNLFGVQFHPEKSGIWGLQILKNFAQLAEDS